jgi:hypothetical protein
MQCIRVRGEPAAQSCSSSQTGECTKCGRGAPDGRPFSFLACAIEQREQLSDNTPLVAARSTTVRAQRVHLIKEDEAALAAARCGRRPLERLSQAPL